MISGGSSSDMMITSSGVIGCFPFQLLLPERVAGMKTVEGFGRAREQSRDNGQDLGTFLFREVI